MPYHLPQCVHREVINAPAEIYQKTGEFKKAAATYVRIFRRHEECGEMDEMLYNAAINFEAAHLLGRAIQVRTVLIERYPESPLSKKAVYLIGQNFQALAYYEQAAKYYMHPLGEVLRAAAPALPSGAMRRLRADGFLDASENLPGQKVAHHTTWKVKPTGKGTEGIRLGARQQKLMALLADRESVVLEELDLRVKQWDDSDIGPDGTTGLDDGFDGGFEKLIVYADRQLHLADQVHTDFVPAVHFVLTPLAAEPLHFRGGHALDAGVFQ